MPNVELQLTATPSSLVEFINVAPQLNSGALDSHTTLSPDFLPPRAEAVQQQVRIRVNELKSQSFAQLAACPPVSAIGIRFGDCEAELVTHRETEPDGRVRIVVQFWPKGTEKSFVWRNVYAEGFLMSPDGEVTVLPDRLRYAYM